MVMQIFPAAPDTRTRRTAMDPDTEPSRRVLLLDDNPAVRESVTLLLKSVGLETIAFHSLLTFIQN